jgi:hypothetical protein
MAGGCEYYSVVDPADEHQGRQEGPSPSAALVEGTLAVVIEASYFRLISVRPNRRGIG